MGHSNQDQDEERPFVVADAVTKMKLDAPCNGDADRNGGRSGDAEGEGQEADEAQGRARKNGEVGREAEAEAGEGPTITRRPSQQRQRQNHQQQRRVRRPRGRRGGGGAAGRIFALELESRDEESESGSEADRTVMKASSSPTRVSPTSVNHHHLEQPEQDGEEQGPDPASREKPVSSSAGSAKNRHNRSSLMSPASSFVSASASPSATAMSTIYAKGSTKSSSAESVKDEAPADDNKEAVPSSVSIKLEPGAPPKLARVTSQKAAPVPPALYSDLPDKTAEASATFDVISSCTYTHKYLGCTDHDAMECDCAEEWDSEYGGNLACGENSDCINRATKMECVGDCNCGSECQNQRFQRQQYADVSVFQTERKGYGLRANVGLRPHQFIFEYIGEVINEGLFRRRMIQYDQEGIKHFYFMSLSKGEFVDATRRGNLGRFCNHSCNPNCYVDKWVVGDKLRMGIFAERAIEPGEELVFNYNVDRYGADPQPCYCGETNCTGFIGGKTQTDRATKLSNATIEALGIDDVDGWDIAVAKRPRKKKTGEEDEEYIDQVEPRSLSEDGVTKVMAALMQSKEKWIVVKLLSRIQRCEDERVRNRVVKMHGYQILNSQLSQWKDDFNVVLQILDILEHFPRLTRNKIIDSSIETTIQPLTKCDDERVATKACSLLQAWATLEIGYRIPRVRRDPSSTATTPAVSQFERRENRESRENGDSRSRSASPVRSPSVPETAPKGPRNSHANRRPPHHGYGNGGGGGGPRPFRRQQQLPPLPPGWYQANDANGKPYYYTSTNERTWNRPTTSPAAPPPAQSKEKALQSIINDILNRQSAAPNNNNNINSATPSSATGPQDMQIETPESAQDSLAPEKEKPTERWRTWSEEKQMTQYECTLSPHVKSVMKKFSGKLPPDLLKRFAKEASKKMVTSDFKHKRVSNPTVVTDKQISQVKKFVKGYFEKAVHKHRAYEKKRTEKRARLRDGDREASGSMQSNGGGSPAVGAQSPTATAPMEDDDDDDFSDPGITIAAASAAESMQQYDLEFVQTPPQPPPPAQSTIISSDPRLKEHNALQ